MTGPWDQWPHEPDFDGRQPGGPDFDGLESTPSDPAFDAAAAGEPYDRFDRFDEPTYGDDDGDPARSAWPAPAEPIGSDLDVPPDEVRDTDPDLDDTDAVADRPAGLDGPVGTDPDRGAEHDPWPDPAFPPSLEFGQLPEPVDGYPWADPTLLGAPHEPVSPYRVPVQPPDPAGLAEYAGVTLPAGADAWTVLADSDDPATRDLARFWATPPPFAPRQRD